MRKKQAIWLALLIALTAQGAQAAGPARQGSWYLYFSGVPFAKIWMGMDESPDSFRVNATVKSIGIIRAIKVFKTSLQSEGALRDGVLRTRRLYYESKAKNARTLLRYDNAGVLIERIKEPEDNPNWRAPVPPDQVQDAYSYTDIVYGLRAALAQLNRANPAPMRFKLYDGKRLSALIMTYEQSEAIELKDGFVMTDKLTLKRELLAGFTPKEHRRFAAGEPPVSLWVRQRDAFPVKMHVRLSFAVIEALWEEGPL